eukprot:g31242.t1
MDFAKAFDKVRRGRLVQKIKFQWIHVLGPLLIDSDEKTGRLISTFIHDMKIGGVVESEEALEAEGQPDGNKFQVIWGKIKGNVRGGKGVEAVTSTVSISDSEVSLTLDGAGEPIGSYSLFGSEGLGMFCSCLI